MLTQYLHSFPEVLLLLPGPFPTDKALPFSTFPPRSGDPTTHLPTATGGQGENSHIAIEGNLKHRNSVEQ